MLDQGRFATLWSRLGLTGDAFATCAALDQAYAHPARYYHTAEHIRDCLEQFERERRLAHHADEAEWAIWFHDAVYDSAAPDNEERSATWAVETLAAAGAPEAVRTRVRALVLATRHDQPPPDDPDAQLITDIDLSILGRDPAAFDRFERQIRQEYAWVPEPSYRAARGRVLRTFLERDPLYRTPPFYTRYEAQAKRNLARVLDHAYPPA